MAINGEDEGTELLPLLLLLEVVTRGGEHDEDEDGDDESEDGVSLLERLLSFFFSPSPALSSIRWCPILVEFKLTGIMQLQNKPTT